MTRPRVYCAHPMTSYGTAHEAACLGALADLVPGAELVDPAATFTSSADWLERWPAMLTTLDALALFADEDGTIGAGCLREVADAIVVGVPIVCLDPCFGLCELAGIDFLPLRSPARTAWPVAGAHVTWHVAGTRPGPVVTTPDRHFARPLREGELHAHVR